MNLRDHLVESLSEHVCMIFHTVIFEDGAIRFVSDYSLILEHLSHPQYGEQFLIRDKLIFKKYLFKIIV